MPCALLLHFVGWFVPGVLCSNDNSATGNFFPSLNMWCGGGRTQGFWNAVDIKVISSWDTREIQR